MSKADLVAVAVWPPHTSAVFSFGHFTAPAAALGCVASGRQGDDEHECATALGHVAVILALLWSVLSSIWDWFCVNIGDDQVSRGSSKDRSLPEDDLVTGILGFSKNVARIFRH